MSLSKLFARFRDLRMLLTRVRREHKFSQFSKSFFSHYEAKVGIHFSVCAKQIKGVSLITNWYLSDNGVFRKDSIRRWGGFNERFFLNYLLEEGYPITLW